MTKADKRAKTKSSVLLIIRAVKVNILFIRYILRQISVVTDLVAGPAKRLITKAF